MEQKTKIRLSLGGILAGYNVGLRNKMIKTHQGFPGIYPGVSTLTTNHIDAFTTGIYVPVVYKTFTLSAAISNIR